MNRWFAHTIFGVLDCDIPFREKTEVEARTFTGTL